MPDPPNPSGLTNADFRPVSTLTAQRIIAAINAAYASSGGAAVDVTYDDTLQPPPLGATNVQAALDALKADIGGGGGALKAPFLFDTSSPYVIQAVSPGQIITRAFIVLTEAFNDPDASISLGTTFDTSQVFGPGDVDVSVTGQYESDLLVSFSSADYLIMTIDPGASSQGAGTLYYWIQ